MRFFRLALAYLTLLPVSQLAAESVPIRAKSGMVVCQSEIASEVGVQILRQGGTAIDAAVATAFTMAVTHPAAGNIGGGGFIIYRPSTGVAAAYDFREMAPDKSDAEMWLVDGKYDRKLHHHSHLAVGVPGTVAGLHLAWTEQGRLPWDQLLTSAIHLADKGFVVSDGLARSLKSALPRMRPYPASIAQFTKDGQAYEAGDLLRQPDLADTLRRIAQLGPAGFYEGKTAELIAAEMRAHNGIITKADLKQYVALRRTPVKGTYRQYQILSMPPPSSGGVALIQMLNLLEGFDLTKSGFGSAQTLHLCAESMKRAFADRARYLGDPEANPDIPLTKLLSKSYATDLRESIEMNQAAVSSPNSFQWATESEETTHISVVDQDRNAVALTYTLEYPYGSAIVVPGAGFLLNNEMGDFNPAPGLTTESGLIGTAPNLAAPRKRMLSSMTPTIVTKNDQLAMVTGSPGGRTIINTVLQTILNVVDHAMNAQEAVDAPRIHHQWLPDTLNHEQLFSPDTLQLLRQKGHVLRTRDPQGAAQVIVLDPKENLLEGGTDRRVPDGAAIGY
ncbi:gamma-glutamyltransferase [bacterium]|nr:gamma-glutamyltransferase [bacterium]